jgi:hypothetical protein
MKKLLVASIATFSLLAVVPGESRAFWNSPTAAAGYGWLGSAANGLCPSIFYHGPLYNYGPYYGGPGYQYQNVQSGFCGAYIPSNPLTYYAMNPYYPNTWGYSNPGIPGTPGSMPSYPVNYYPPSGPGAFPAQTTSAVKGAPASTSAASTAPAPVESITQSSTPVEGTYAGTTSSPGFFKSLRARWQH